MQNLFIISHRRSGTHLTIDSILNNFPNFICKQEPEKYFTLSFNPPLQQMQKLKALQSCLIKTHILPDFKIYNLSEEQIESFLTILNDSFKIYVYRNGLDVMVSMYFYLGKFRPEIKQMSFSEFLRWEQDLEPIEGLTPPQLWNLHINSWLDSDLLKKNTLMLKYEDLVNDYFKVLEKIADFLAQPLPNKPVDIRMKNPIGSGWLAYILGELKKKIRKLRGQTVTAVLPRKGKINQYKKFFTSADLDYFFKVAGQAMDRLGYKI